MFNDRRRTYPDGSSTWTSWRERLESFAYIVGLVLAVGAGITLLVLAVPKFGDSYHLNEEFSHAKDCGDDLDCGDDDLDSFERLEVLVVGRDIEQTTSPNSDPHMPDTTTTDYILTCQRPDGSRSTHEVSAELYRNSQEGQAATLRMWRGHVIAITAGTETYWFLSPGAEGMAFWLVTAVAGLALLAWGSVWLALIARQMRRERKWGTRAG
ncbi:hypothetical protein ACWF99_02835 [Nocardia sp. NPDC055002]